MEDEISAPSPQSTTAFIRHFVALEPRLYAFIRTTIYSKPDAQDVLQESAAVMWEKWHEFTQGTSFESWAFCIVRWQIMAYRKRVQRSRLHFDDELVTILLDEASADVPRPHAEGEELEECLGKLPQDEQDLISRRYMEGNTSRSVATALGRSESSISRHLNRIMDKLMQCMQSPTALNRA
jgi:RNA polymerase sigma-70 factor, ECF subfamily